MAATFADLPDRTVTVLGPNGEPTSAVSYQNQIDGGLRNPRSTSWNLELDRQVLSNLSLRVAYEQRNTSNDLIVSPVSRGTTGILGLSNNGSDSYREFQVAARLKTAPEFSERLLCPIARVRRPQRRESVLWESGATRDPAGRARSIAFRRAKPFLVLGLHRSAVETHRRSGLRPAHRLSLFDRRRVSQPSSGPATSIVFRPFHRSISRFHAGFGCPSRETHPRPSGRWGLQPVQPL